MYPLRALLLPPVPGPVQSGATFPGLPLFTRRVTDWVSLIISGFCVQEEDFYVLLNASEEVVVVVRRKSTVSSAGSYSIRWEGALSEEVVDVEIKEATACPNHSYYL